MARFLVVSPLLLGAALLAGCGPSGQCDGMVGGTRVHGDIDGDSLLVIHPANFRPTDESAQVRAAKLRLSYGEGAMVLITELKLPARQDTTPLPLVLSQEEAQRRQASEGMVSLWKLEAPAQAPALSGGTFTVRLADPNNLEGKIDALFEDGSRLECTYDLRGPNYVPGDDPTYNGPP
jgi:hypothetical protein